MQCPEQRNTASDMPRKREFTDCDCVFDPNGEGEMKFVNCDIKLPAGGGAYVVDSGCGSGKSTVIRKIISQKYKEGILVVLPTIEECDKLENEINRMGVPITVGNLHSRSALFKTFLDHPASMSQFQVLIITQIRLFINDWSLFLPFNFLPLESLNCTDWENAMTGKGVQLRKWIFLDELATFIKPMAVIDSGMFETLSYTDQHKTHNREEGYWLSGNYYKHIYDSDRLKVVYDNQKNKFFTLKSKLNDFMTKTVLGHIDQHRKDILEAKGEYVIRNRMQDYIFPSMQPKIVIWDGSGEPIFKKSSGIKLLTPTDKPYNSDIEFKEFKMPVKRDCLTAKMDKEINALVDEMVRQINTLPLNESLLYICWKNIRIKEINTYNKDFKEEDKADKYDLVGILKQRLLAKKIPESRFAIIYRGSGKDKAVNDYKDFSAVSFLGEWKVPNDIVTVINATYGCQCNYQDFRLTQMIQAICRIRIRQHNDQPITVFYSSDISNDLMYALFKYFKSHSSGKVTGISSPSPKARRETKYIFALLKLYSFDSKIRDAVWNDTPYSFSISLSDLSSLIPMGRSIRKWESYEGLVKFLKEGYSITMTKK